MKITPQRVRHLNPKQFGNNAFHAQVLVEVSYIDNLVLAVVQRLKEFVYKDGQWFGTNQRPLPKNNRVAIALNRYVNSFEHTITHCNVR